MISRVCAALTRAAAGRRAACGALVLLGLTAPVWPQGGPELTRLVDSPTAGLIEKGKYEFDLRLFAAGGVAAYLGAGALQRLTIGVAYGGEQILGDQPVDWYPRLEAGVRYRLCEESTAWPALVVGYETQGYGARHGGEYTARPKGAFCAVSKNYTSALGQFGVHGGVHLPVGGDTDDEDWSGWLGMDKSVNRDLVAVVEYDLGRQADGRAGSGLSHPLVHAGARLQFSPQLSLALLLKDLLRSGTYSQVARELSVRYTEEF